MPIRQCLAPGLDDMVGRLKVRLSDAQVDDVVPSPLQFARARQHLEGGFGAELAHALRKRGHGGPS